MVKAPFLVWEKSEAYQHDWWSNLASLDERQRAKFGSTSEPGEPNFTTFTEILLKRERNKKEHQQHTQRKAPKPTHHQPRPASSDERGLPRRRRRRRENSKDRTDGRARPGPALDGGGGMPSSALLRHRIARGPCGRGPIETVQDGRLDTREKYHRSWSRVQFAVRGQERPHARRAKGARLSEGNGPKLLAHADRSDPEARSNATRTSYLKGGLANERAPIVTADEDGRWVRTRK
jgi:hypothetical protein